MIIKQNSVQLIVNISYDGLKMYLAVSQVLFARSVGVVGVVTSLSSVKVDADFGLA